MSEKLEIIITAKDKGVSKTLKKISVDMGKFGDATEKTAKQSKKAAASTKDLGKSFKGLSTSLMAGVGGIVAAGFALKKAFDFAKQGAGMLRLQDAGESLAASFGTSMDTIVDTVRAASFSTISDMDIIAAANKAMMLGVATDAKTMGDLMQVAMARGRAMGLSTAQAFNDIVVGIGRASPMILDNLGIVLDAERVYGKYADSIGKAAGALTKAEKVQALTTATIKEGGKLIEEQGGIYQDAAGDIEAMDAAWANMVNTLKMGVAPALAGAAKGVTETVVTLTSEYDAWVQMNQAVEDGVITRDQYNQIQREANASIEDEVTQLGLLAEQIRINEMARGYAIMSMSAEEQALWRLSTATANWGTYLDQATQKQTGLSGTFDPTITKFNALSFAARDAKESVVGYNASIRAASSAGELLAQANQSIASSISSLRKDIDWLAAGGLELQLQFEQVKNAVLENAITPEEAKGMLGNLFIQAQGLEIEMGDIDFAGAAKAISTELEIPLDDATKALEDLQSGVDDLDIEQAFKDALAPTDELREAFGLMGDSVEELTELEVASYMEGWGSALDTSLNPSLETSKTLLGEVVTIFGVLPDSKDIYVTVHYSSAGDPEQKQHGGPVSKDTPYLVGEVGPELFVPSQSGNIIPNNQISYGGAEVTVNVTTGSISSDIDIEDLAWTLARRIQESV
jgi:hypothetical protein